jgi:hypothetical protein
MFYTTIGRVVAGLALAVGVAGIALGFGVATGEIVEPKPGYYLAGKTSGEAIDTGIMRVLFAICLGVLTDISRHRLDGSGVGR